MINTTIEGIIKTIPETEETTTETEEINITEATKINGRATGVAGAEEVIDKVKNQIGFQRKTEISNKTSQSLIGTILIIMMKISEIEINSNCKIMMINVCLQIQEEVVLTAVA